MDAVHSRNKASKYIGNMDSVILLIFVAYGFVSQYFYLSVIAGIVFTLILKKLWKPFYPPVLLFFISFQWLQVFGSILFADFLGEKIDVLFNSKDIEYLFIFTFLQIGVMTYVLSNYLNLAKGVVVSRELMVQAANKLHTKNIIVGYFISTLSLPFLISFTIGSASLNQLVLSFGIIKYLFTGLLVFILLLQDTKDKKLIIGILIFDFVLSFASFFSNFKVLLIMIIIIYFTVNPFLKKSAAYKMIPVLILLLILFFFWSAIKNDYREYLNKGTSLQQIEVSNTEALAFVFEKVETMDFSSLKEGATTFLERLQYMQRYCEVYARVPSVIPHQNGKDLYEAVNFVLIPRFINANKGVKDASLRTSHYTGRRFSNAERGTSVSMGYFCDLYIDYGLYLMFIPLIAMTAIIGFMYKKLLSFSKYNILFTYSLIIGAFLSLGTFESDTVFFLGIFRNNAVLLILGYWLFFRSMHRFILKKR